MLRSSMHLLVRCGRNGQSPAPALPDHYQPPSPSSTPRTSPWSQPTLGWPCHPQPSAISINHGDWQLENTLAPAIRQVFSRLPMPSYLAGSLVVDIIKLLSSACCEIAAAAAAASSWFDQARSQKGHIFEDWNFLVLSGRQGNVAIK